MDNDKEMVSSATRARETSTGNKAVQSLQEKTGATAEQIRKAIEQVGFDRDKVEEYLMQKKQNA